MVTALMFWTFIAANTFVLVVGGALTYLSFSAYRRTGRASLRYAVGGFGIITAGALVEGVYEVFVRGDHQLGAEEILLLNTSESILIGLGLALIFYSLNSR